MTMEILDQIKGIVSKRSEVPVEQLTDATRLEDLGVGSLEDIEIVYDIEEKFGISVPIKPGETSLLPATETQGTKATETLATTRHIAPAVHSLSAAKSHQSTGES